MRIEDETLLRDLDTLDRREAIRHLQEMNKCKTKRRREEDDEWEPLEER